MWSSYWLSWQDSAQVYLFLLLPPKAPPQTDVIIPQDWTLHFIQQCKSFWTEFALFSCAYASIFIERNINLKSINLVFFCVLELSGQNCSHPIMAEHGGFYCKPSPCRGFTLKSRIYYFCESGYILPNHVHHSTCRKGRWDPSIPTCIPNSGKTEWLHLLFTVWSG